MGHLTDIAYAAASDIDVAMRMANGDWAAMAIARLAKVDLEAGLEAARAVEKARKVKYLVNFGKRLSKSEREVFLTYAVVQPTGNTVDEKIDNCHFTTGQWQDADLYIMLPDDPVEAVILMLKIAKRVKELPDIVVLSDGYPKFIPTEEVMS